MMGLTPQQARALSFIRSFIGERGVVPSFDEIAGGVGTRSRGAAHGLVTQLERRGAIRRLRHRARSIEIINDTDTLAKVSNAALLDEV
jgi:SOS-response transcriptional repressor LexA